MTSTASAAQRHDSQADLRGVVVRLGSATLHEAAGQIGALPSEIMTRTPGLPLVGYMARIMDGRTTLELYGLDG